ncbi:MAG: hypothetical protein EOP06_09445 [Proteobacteria bacterium]|nr:MAG: hypothetical protein EOP06_09445 [Pseudomonadota bacterium]
MLPLIPPIEFDGFDHHRQLGLKWLAKKGGKPTQDEWRYGAVFWKPACLELYTYFRGICNYSCLWISRGTGSRSVEHFISRDKDASLAFEWSNFRFVCGTLNGSKSSFEDVLDPFSIGPDWFHINFKTLRLHPNATLPPDIQDLCEQTIQRLKLNDDEWIEGRSHWIEQYCSHGPASFPILRRHAPHVAIELMRQGLVDTICSKYIV